MGGNSLLVTGEYLCRTPWKLGVKFIFLKHVYWGRYVDDIISLWNYGENERIVLDHLNPYDRNSQFTLEIESTNKIPFLDALIIRSIDKLDFTTYRKPTQNKDILF